MCTVWSEKWGSFGLSMRDRPFCPGCMAQGCTSWGFCMYTTPAATVCVKYGCYLLLYFWWIFFLQQPRLMLISLYVGELEVWKVVNCLVSYVLVDVDECTNPNQCAAGATCNNLDGSFECTCLGIGVVGSGTRCPGQRKLCWCACVWLAFFCRV